MCVYLCLFVFSISILQVDNFANTTKTFPVISIKVFFSFRNERRAILMFMKNIERKKGQQKVLSNVSEVELHLTLGKSVAKSLFFMFRFYVDERLMCIDW